MKQREMLKKKESAGTPKCERKAKFQKKKRKEEKNAKKRHKHCVK